jgi:hypothetical protein
MNKRGPGQKTAGAGNEASPPTRAAPMDNAAPADAGVARGFFRSRRPSKPNTKREPTMNANIAPLAPIVPSTHRVRRAVGVVVALLLASLAFGVGLPWIIVDAPPEAETLWAREIQSRTPAAAALVSPSAARRSAAALSVH